MARRHDLGLRAWYTVGQLATLAGVHRNAMRVELRRGRVPIHDAGPRSSGRVFVAELRRQHRALWDSIVAVASVADAGR